MNGKTSWSKFVACLALLLCLTVCGRAYSVHAEELTGCTSEEVVEQMGVGWNLGNTFDATGGNASDIFSQEQSWGNPIVTKELIDAVKEAGFTTIRIPVTWYKHISADGSYTIDEAFLERVKTVVDYAYEDGLFILLNVHHEEWVNVPDLPDTYEKVGEELAAVWRQLADYFAEYDQHLIFEGMNEPRMAGTDLEWTGNQEAYAAVNYLAQVFVNTVRSSQAGHNQERCLMIPGYAASSSSAIQESIAVPTVNGEAVNNLIISVHCYSPYDFCLSDSRKDFDPEDSACVSDIDNTFRNIQKLFLDNGIPVVIGETSATNKDNTEAREKWAYYMGSKAAAYGVPIVIWDNGANGNSGGECHAYINRKTNEWNYPTVVKALMDGKDSIAWGTGRDAASQTGDSLVGGSAVWSNADGLASTAQWDASYIVMGAKSTWFAESREVAIVFSGNGEPKIVLDSEAKGAWWIPVDPDRIEEQDGRKVAYFTYEDMMREMGKAGVDDPADLRNMSVLAANDNITTYEISITGGEPVAVFKVNGADYYVGADLPEDPSYTNMEFLGWYTTKDYQAGTEYTGGELTGDITVYAKFQLTKEALEKPEEQEKPSEDSSPAESSPENTTAQSGEESKDAAESSGAGESEQQKTEAETQGQTAEPSDGINPLLIVLGIVAAVLVIGAVVFVIRKKAK